MTHPAPGQGPHPHGCGPCSSSPGAHAHPYPPPPPRGNPHHRPAEGAPGDGDGRADLVTTAYGENDAAGALWVPRGTAVSVPPQRSRPSSRPVWSP
ncbi:FG-GAP repeat protein [Streptomyces sp. NPDC008159]|uniref:FG-GAP repeat protein n=1 Tax=Streptomyces sp. NPDC008159 TaxID=3364817 RepID=UPI0036F09B6F